MRRGGVRFRWRKVVWMGTGSGLNVCPGVSLCVLDMGGWDGRLWRLL